MKLSVVIPALNERENIALLVPALIKSIPRGVDDYEIIVVDGNSSDCTAEIAEGLGATVVQQTDPGYGGALCKGFAEAQGEYIATMDADLSHPPALLRRMWDARDKAEVVIASRYIAGGSANVGLWRKFLSRVLNLVFTRGLSLPIHDVSSGFRLYKASALKRLTLKSSHYDILEEILIRIWAEGWQVIEVPLQYRPRRNGRSHVRLFEFGVAYLATFLRMWSLRNSIDSADYDFRAFDSKIPLQRYWQRKRAGIVRDFTDGADRTLDIGCGSSRILLGLSGAIGIDIKIGKARFMRRHHAQVVNGSAFSLPFPDQSFDCVVCSQLIEHLPWSPTLFEEMVRVLAPGGRLIIGTPDYGGRTWPAIERLYGWFAPGGYADEHITHYSRQQLVQVLEAYGFRCSDVGYVGHAEMILQFERAVDVKCEIAAGG